jgi:hypothetical protein
MDEHMNCSSLPIELQKNLVAFLDYNDAFQFSQCSKLIQQNLSLSTFSLALPLILDSTWYGDANHGDIPQTVRPIPLLFCNRVHSVILRARWEDQGWGNQKGQVYVIAQRDNCPNRVVYESPVAHHHEDDLQMSFNPVESENYFIYQKAGGGGGHILRVKNMTAQVIIFDCVGQHIAKNCDALQERGALRDEQPFHFHVLKASAQALRTQVKNGIALDVDLVRMFESNGISLDLGSLEAMIEICDAFLENIYALLSHFLSRNRVDANAARRVEGFRMFIPDEADFLHGVFQQAAFEMHAFEDVDGDQMEDE